MIGQINATKTVREIKDVRDDIVLKLSPTTLENVSKVVGTVEFKKSAMTAPDGSDIDKVDVLRMTLNLRPMEIKVQPHDDFLEELETRAVTMIAELIEEYLKV